MQILLKQFHQYLVKKSPNSLSDSTVNNYLSDVKQFLRFVKKSHQQSVLTAAHITPAVVAHYRGQLQNLPTATANRKLSSLRRFGLFLAEAHLSEQNPTHNLANLDIDKSHLSSQKVLKEFHQFLIDQKLSDSTVNNYVSDVKAYLAWARVNLPEANLPQNAPEPFNTKGQNGSSASLQTNNLSKI